jgi:ABC-type antimicrobial peptide transport system permease subunit
MSAAVGDRIREIGIRIALRATPARMRSAVLADALKMVAFGAAIGLTGALFTSRLFAKLLFHVSPTDPATLLMVCALLLGVGLIAAYVPARRATRADPAVALRSE